jgi:hypothetical protein
MRLPENENKCDKGRGNGLEYITNPLKNLPKKRLLGFIHYKKTAE